MLVWVNKYSTPVSPDLTCLNKSAGHTMVGSLMFSVSVCLIKNVVTLTKWSLQVRRSLYKSALALLDGPVDKLVVTEHQLGLNGDYKLCHLTFGPNATT